MLPEKRKIFFLFLLTGFLAGLAIGVFSNSEEAGASPLFIMLIFSTGLSIGAFITRLQQEFKHAKNSQQLSGPITNN